MMMMMMMMMMTLTMTLTMTMMMIFWQICRDQTWINCISSPQLQPHGIVFMACVCNFVY